MKAIPLHRRNIPASRLVLGCMGFGGDWDNNPVTADHIRQGEAAVESALSVGIRMFDHANIYTNGKAEQVFGHILRDRKDLRDRIYIQSKCGIRFTESPEVPGRYDFSKAHILESVDGSLKRLGVESLDFLLLHRPDPLMDPEEVADAVRILKAAGKVRWFGVSNMSAGQIQLLQAYSPEPLIVNQLEMSLTRIGWLETGVHVNQDAARQNVMPEGTIEYCQLRDIQIQAWGPLANGYLTGRPLDGQPETVKATAKVVAELAQKKGVSGEAIILAWLLKHPAGIQPVIGTTNPDRIRACGQAENVSLTREEWYRLYVCARGVPLP